MYRGRIKFSCFVAFFCSGLVSILAGQLLVGMVLIGLAILIPAS